MQRRKRIVEPENLEPVSGEDEAVPEDIELDEAGDEEAPARGMSLADEPLFAALLRQAIAKLWPEDPVMTDFVAHVAGPLSEHLGTLGAKGGDFVVERIQQELDVKEGYILDQSFRAHLINGLFPVLNIARALKSWDAPRLQYLDNRTRRLFIAGYVLHDWLKLPEVDKELQATGLSYNTVNPTQDRELIEGLFLRWCEKLGLRAFLEPVGGTDIVLHDLVYIACNTQVKWGTLRNPSALPRLSLDGRALDLCESFSRLADLITYVAPTPRQVTAHVGIHREVAELSNNTARLVYHHVADNRGVLTNIIHNAALEAMSHPTRIPFLYAPSGVVYLEYKDAPALPDVEMVTKKVVERVRQVSAHRLRVSLTGFGRDGKGLKRADYYNLFFALSEQICLAVRAAFKHISSSKPPSAGKRFAKMDGSGWLDSSVDLNLSDDIRVDQLAEWCYLAETLVSIGAPNFDTADFLFGELGLTDLRSAFDAVPRDNRAGGVGYHWYFAAGHYLKRHSGKDPAEWQAMVEGLAERLVTILTERMPTISSAGDSWQELQAYARQVLSFGPLDKPPDTDRSLFTAELARYQNAKRIGRGRSAVCSLCSSPFQVNKQQESAILFAPMVYSNKLPLHGATAIRDICPICGLEIMLRQILMNRSGAKGSRFEGRQVRYLYFYPTYFFSPETLEIFRTIHNRLQRIGFTELRRQLAKGTTNNGVGNIHLDTATLQRLEPLLLSAQDLTISDSDRYVRMHFPEHEPITFYFLGIPPPSRNARDAEAWVHPAFLALLLPICLDIKVVASTSPLPLLLEADELAETVFLDGAHPFVQALVGRERINVDQVLPCLQRLTVAYLIHLDAHSKQGRGGWDYRWSDIPPLARDLAIDAAYACSYLKKWQRRTGSDGIPFSKAQQFLNYMTYLREGGLIMSPARTLVDLSRQFYRARRYNSNSILRPLSVAAKAILSANRRLFDREGLTEAVRGELIAFMDRVGRGDAVGFRAPRLKGEERADAARRREIAIRSFAEYFVGTIFYDTLRGDVAALRGKQLNLLKNAYEVLYRDAAARSRKEAEEAESEEAEPEEQTVAEAT
jgi:CRISPR-associated protein Csc3